MASHYRERGTWTVAYSGRLDGKLRGRSYIYGIKTEKMARAAAAKKGSEEDLLRAGLLHVDPQSAKLRKAELTPIGDHVAAFEQHILACNREPQHASQQAQHVRRLFKLAHIERLSQVAAEPLQAAAKALMNQQDLAPRTANAAIKAVRQFSTWCSTHDRLQHDVLHRRLSTYNEEEDQRRRRRALSQEEYEWLITWMLSGKDKNNRCGINRTDRGYLYQVAIGTGYRQDALLSLAPRNFHVEPGNDRPYVALAAARNKSRRDREQPIRDDLAGALRAWLEDKDPDRPLWQLKAHATLALRFRRDLDGARQAWIDAAGDDGPEKSRRQESTFLSYVHDDGQGLVWCDFHGLRHTGITFAVRAGGLKGGQIWAGHSTPVLTSRYAHMDLMDERKVLDGLPAAVSKAGPAPAPAQSGKSLAPNGTNKPAAKAG